MGATAYNRRGREHQKHTEYSTQQPSQSLYGMDGEREQLSTYHRLDRLNSIDRLVSGTLVQYTAATLRTTTSTRSVLWPPVN